MIVIDNTGDFRHETFPKNFFAQIGYFLWLVSQGNATGPTNVD